VSGSSRKGKEVKKTRIFHGTSIKETPAKKEKTLPMKKKSKKVHVPRHVNRPGREKIKKKLTTKKTRGKHISKEGKNRIGLQIIGGEKNGKRKENKEFFNVGKRLKLDRGWSTATLGMKDKITVGGSHTFWGKKKKKTCGASTGI